MLEPNLQEEGADYDRIGDERCAKAYPILRQMEQWMKTTININKCMPKSPLGKAIRYAFGIWPRINRYCKEGDYQIDNNGIENTIRHIALGRKNCLFSGNDSGAEDNCIFTHLSTAVCKPVDPHQWHTSILE